MNILVTGANGQLGNCLRNAVERGSKDHYIFTDVAELDITDAAAVSKMVKDNDVNMIVNCAAYTNVDKAEDDADFAEILNAVAPRNLAEALKPVDGTLIHVSTDYVFGGNAGNTPRAEKSLPIPREFTVSPSYTASSRSKPPVSEHSHFARHGYILNMAKTSSRPCFH